LVEYRRMSTLFFIFFRGIALATHATSFNVVMHSLAIGFGPSQQGLLVVGIVYSGMMVSL